MPSTASVSVRAKNLASRATTITASVSKTPDPTVDFIKSFSANSGIKIDFSNEFIIDLFPDGIPSMSYFISMCSKYSNDVDRISHAKATPPTMMYYVSSLYYAFFLANDMFVRPSPSEHAQVWIDHHTRSEFIEFVLSLPVPEFMIPIFSQLAATETERRKNIHVVPTAAGFNYSLFFGKFLPPSFFLAIHNTMSNLTATDRPSIMHALFDTALYRITNVATTGTQAYIASPLDFIGGHFTATGARLPNTKWLQFFEMHYNPVLTRSYQRRAHLAHIPFSAPTFPTPQAINPYDLLFAPTLPNLSEAKIVLQALAGIMKDIVPFKSSLCEVISSLSGISALNHGYTNYTLPVMIHDTTATTAKAAFVTLERRDPSQVASSVRFLGVPPPDMNNNTIGAPFVALATAPDTPVTTHVIRNLFSTIFYRVHQADSALDNPADTDFVTYNDDEHLFPHVRILDVSGTADVDGYLATLAGKVIETLDIDGNTIAHPNPKQPLGVENSLFFDSSIPFNLVFPRTNFDTHRTTLPTAVALKRVAPLPQTQHATSSLLVDRTVVTIPKYEPTQSEPTGTNFFAGLTSANNVTRLRYALRFLGFHSADQSHPDYDTPPNCSSPRPLLVWSPYTITTRLDDTSFDAPNPANSRRYFLVNLRSLFGTDVPLVEVKHPMQALPV